MLSEEEKIQDIREINDDKVCDLLLARARFRLFHDLIKGHDFRDFFNEWLGEITFLDVPSESITINRLKVIDKEGFGKLMSHISDNPDFDYSIEWGAEGITLEIWVSADFEQKVFKKYNDVIRAIFRLAGEL